MEQPDKQEKWLITHFKNTKNKDIAEKLGISESSVHRIARKHGLVKTKQFMRKVQHEAAILGSITNKRNNWPPKGYKIPGREANQYEKGITPEQRLGKKRNAERIRKSAEARKQTFASEKRRVLFGLPQRTKLKVVRTERKKAAYKYTLKKRGYIVARASSIVMITEHTDRSPIVERTARERYRFQLREFV